MKSSVISAAMAAAVVAGLASGCNREPEFTGADEQAIVSREVGEPMSVAGCLRAGTANNTFVLTTSQAAGQETATYNLVIAAGAETIDLKEHVGRQVQVNGTLLAETEITSRSTTAPQERAEGTAGTPEVRTKTEFEVKRLQVNSVTPSNERCEG